MSEKFTVAVADEPGGRVCVVALAGTLDPPACEVLDPKIDALVAAGRRRFVFDLTGLRYIGSLGLRTLVGLSNRVRGEGTVALCGLSRDVRSVLELTKVTAILRVYPTRADAVDAAQSR